jgi:hypothetical protein
MDLRDQAAQLRKAIEAAGPRNAKRKVPDTVRRAVVEHAAVRRAEGVGTEAIVRELGISPNTLARWAGYRAPKAAAPRAAKAPTFHRVAVTPPATVAAPAAPLVVYGPHGLRIEGLDVAALAALLARFA